MVAVLRALGAIAAGMVLAFLLVIAVEFFSAVVHPFPPDFKGTSEEVCRHVERCPAWVLAVAVAAWGGTVLASTWTTGRLGNRGCAVFVGLLLLAGAVFNLSMLPYPTWFEVAVVIIIPLAIVAGVWWSRRRVTAPAKDTE